MKHKSILLAISLVSVLCACDNNNVNYVEYTQKIAIRGYYYNHEIRYYPTLITYDIFESIDSLNESYPFLKESYKLGAAYEITISYPESVYTDDDFYFLMSGTRLIPTKYIKNITLLAEPNIKTITKKNFKYDSNGNFYGITPDHTVRNIIDNPRDKTYSVMPAKDFKGDTLYGFYHKEINYYYLFTNYPDLTNIPMFKAPAYSPELDRIIPQYILT